MTEELATVTSIDGDKVTLSSQIKSTCSGCSQVDSCANGQISKALPKQQLRITIDIPDDCQLSVGDCVVLGIPDGELLASAGQVYLFPLLGLIIFSGLGQWLLHTNIVNQEIISLFIGISGGYLGYVFAKYLQQGRKYAEKLQPKILRVLAKTSE